MNWTSHNGIDTLVIIRAILTMRVILCQDGSYVIRANGRQLKYVCYDRMRAREIAEKSVKNVVKSLNKALEDM
jgi:hypothetical protein